MVELSVKKERSEEMGKIIMRQWDLREFHVQVNFPAPKRQDSVLLWWEVILIGGFQTPSWKLYARLLISACILQIGLMFIPHHSL